MARLAPPAADSERARRVAARECGPCSHCCSVLRVDELDKRAGVDCVHQRGSAGCAIHPERPSICRAYECLWLQGGLEDDERPDQTGGIVDLETTGIGLRLGIREVQPGAFEQSPALQAIAARYRDQMPVRITDARDVMNPDRPFRVLLADGVEQRLSGDRIEILRDGVLVEQKRLPWAERLGRRFSIAIRRLSLRGRSRRRPESAESSEGQPSKS